MSAAQLLVLFHRLADAPDAIPCLRRFILDLAVRGKLVEQDPNEETAIELARHLRKEAASPPLGSNSRWPVPDTWAFVPLAALATPSGLFTDGDWVESKDQDPDGDVRLIQLADIGSGVYRNRSSRFMNTATAARLNCTFLSEGDILIARMPDPLAGC